MPMTRATRPIVLVAAANDRLPGGAFLAGLAEEMRGVREALEGGRRSERWVVDPRPGLTRPELLSLLRDPAYAARIAVFHYAGHAAGDRLLLEGVAGASAETYAGGLAALLGQLPALRLVFLNGCETKGQAEALLAAGIGAVVATDVRIADAVASAFAIDFYRALVDGRTLQGAFRHAEAAARLRVSEHARAAWRDLGAPGEDEPAAWPWALHPEAGPALGWTLADVLDEPAVALPSLRSQRLPARPYRHLLPFTRSEAAVFFGRARDLRQLLEAVLDPEGAPVVLLFGGAGAGKSSLLDAGLLARLPSDVVARYARRDEDTGLGGTLRGLLDLAADADRGALNAAWSSLEDADRRVVLVVDQVEEAFTRPRGDPREELRAFAGDLAALLDERENDVPQHRVVLGFRKEWLAEVQSALGGVWHASQFLDRLDEAAVVEAVRGPVDDARLARQYHLEIEDGLAQTIARDMLADPLSPVAPTLQVLLARMWDEAPVQNGVWRVFDHALYQRLRREGLLLGDFLDQQLEALGRTEYTAALSGLALDVLHAHTTAHATAAALTADALAVRYLAAADALPSLLQRCIDLFLLTTVDGNDGAEGRVTRLIHDTLAPLVRERFERSDRPGQRARRLLELRVRDRAERGVPLPQEDLDRIEAGLSAMRALDDAEQDLLRDAREARRVANLVRQAAAMPDPLYAARRLITLRGLYEPPGGAAIAAAVAAQALPLFEIEPGPTRDVGHVMKAELSRDGRLLILQHYDSVRIVRADDGAEVGRFPHGDRLVDSAVAPDGTRLLTVEGSDLHLWPLKEGSSPGTITFEEPLSAAVWHPDGRTIAVLGMAGTVYVVEPDATRPAASLPSPYPVSRPPLFSADGRWLLTVASARFAGELGMAVDPADPEAEFVCLRPTTEPDRYRSIFPFHGVEFVDFSPRSDRVLCGDRDGFRMLACEGEERVEIPTPDGFFLARISPDGTRLALTGGGYDVTLQALDGNGSAQPTRLRHAHMVKDIAFSPDGRQLAVTTQSGIRLWPAGMPPGGFPFPTSDAEVDWFLPHGNAGSAEFSADGSRIVTTGDMTAGTLRVWSNRPPVEPVRVRHASLAIPAVTVAWSPGGACVASASEGDIRVWRPDGAECARLALDGSGFLEFRGDSHLLVTDSKGVLRLWHFDSGRVEEIDAAANVGLLTADADGWQVLACAGSSLLVWRDGDLDRPLVIVHDHDVRSAAFGGGGGYVTSVTEAGVHVTPLHDPAAAEVVGGSAMSAQLSPDATRLLIVSDAGELHLMRSDVPGRPLLLDHSQHVQHALFSPDGSRILAVSGRTAHVWSGDGRQELHVLQSEDVLASAEYSRDGAHVLLAPRVGWGQSRVLIFRADGQGDPVVLPHPTGVTSARFGPDGTRVATGAADGCARVWRVGWDGLLEHLEAVAGSSARPD